MNKDDLIQFLCRKKQYRVSQYEDGSFLVSKTWNHGLSVYDNQSKFLDFNNIKKN